MREPMTKLSFTVTSVEEIRTVIETWEQVNVLPEGDPLKKMMLFDKWHRLEIALAREEGPERRILLLISAPLSVSERFRQTLLNMKLRVQWDYQSPELLITCRFLPSGTKPKAGGDR
jgi:hypothetical protein